MPQYEITSPDGKKFRVTAPDGATKEQVLEYAKQSFQKSATPQPEPEKPANPLLEAALNKGWGTGLGPFLKEFGGKITDWTGSPALGAAAPVLGQAVEMSVGGNVAKSAAPILENISKSVMQSALKPKSADILSGDAAKAIETLLKEGVNITSAGMVKLRQKIQALEKQARAMIDDAGKTSVEAGLPPAAVDVAFVEREVAKELKKFGNQVNPESDVKAVQASWEEFKKKVGNSDKIPIQEAHELKKGTYGILADKYAKQGTVENVPGTQAQMAQARGLRLGAEDAVPGLGKVTQEESQIINALEMAERRAGIGGNKDVGGIAWIASNPAAASAMMADRSAAFKSWLANKIYQHKTVVPAGVGAVAAGSYPLLSQEE